MQENQKTLTQLFIPICLETLLYMLAGMVDTLMLSSVGDQAVGAVGTAAATGAGGALVNSMEKSSLDSFMA